LTSSTEKAEEAAVAKADKMAEEEAEGRGAHIVSCVAKTSATLQEIAGTTKWLGTTLAVLFNERIVFFSHNESA
jgi:hypothetical protein